MIPVSRNSGVEKLSQQPSAASIETSVEREKAKQDNRVKGDSLAKPKAAMKALVKAKKREIA